MLDRTDTLTLQREAFRRDVLEGLALSQKTIPARWLYDDRGSELFEDITKLDEYYPTRTERAILERHAGDIAQKLGPRASLIEYGAGAGIKTEIVLDALDDPELYVPIDIAGDFLEASAERLRGRFPALDVHPVVGDFTDDIDLPDSLPDEGRRCGFFPGSTIGNLDPKDAVTFLKRMRGHVGRGGRAVLGADLKKPIEDLRRAYDDSEGVTAAFNQNLLIRINRELGGDFPNDAFHHEARWNDAESAVEMHLVADREVSVSVAGQSFDFHEGETIHTESSRKYDRESLGKLAGSAGWEVESFWTDDKDRFSVTMLKAA